MGVAARDATGKTKLQAVADRGCYSGPQIKACHDAGIAVMPSDWLPASPVSISWPQRPTGRTSALPLWRSRQSAGTTRT